jgi:hypothetical protein
MKVLCLTWNSNNNFSLNLFNKDLFNKDYQILIISLQETFLTDLTDLNNNYFKNFKKLNLNIKLIQSFGLVTIVLSRDKLNIKSYRIGQGVLGFPNKGFILTEIYRDNSLPNSAPVLVHVNCHLAAHSENHLKRSKQIDQIISPISNQIISPTSNNISCPLLFTGDFNFRSLLESNSFLEKYPLFSENQELCEKVRFQKNTCLLR